ncbi:MAG: PHP domain-containing protein [Coriobacteriales bacterium]
MRKEGKTGAGDEKPGCLDLHCHSRYSDGSLSVSELIKQAREAGLSGLAITDHDWLGQLSKVRALAQKEAFPVLAGVEVSAFDPAAGRKVHVLGYGLQATSDDSGPLERLVAPTRNARTANTLWQAWTLRHKGVTFEGAVPSLDDVADAASESGSVFKQHLMWTLTHLPYTDESYQEFYLKHFKNGGIACRDITYPDALDAVHAIREQGGVAVLAHPGQTDSWGLVPDLVHAGLQGIEAYHPDHTPDDVARATDAANSLGLFLTGGSDYHGIYGRPPQLGCSCISEDEAGQDVADLFFAEEHLS